MSLFPCDGCNQRPRGPLNSLYQSVLEHNNRVGRKYRLCADCLQAHEDSVTAKMIDVATADELHDNGVSPNCMFCQQTSQRRLGFFETIYRKGDERSDYYAQVCYQCACRHGPSPTWA